MSLLCFLMYNYLSIYQKKLLYTLFLQWWYWEMKFLGNTTPWEPREFTSVWCIVAGLFINMLPQEAIGVWG